MQEPPDIGLRVYFHKAFLEDRPVQPEIAKTVQQAFTVIKVKKGKVMLLGSDETTTGDIPLNEFRYECLTLH